MKIVLRNFIYDIAGGIVGRPSDVAKVDGETEGHILITLPIQGTDMHYETAVQKELEGKEWDYIKW